jgi:glycosyltransferase involved in cell wall biosynthesis
VAQTKVTHVIHSLTGGGIERRALSVIAGLDQTRFESVLVCIDGRGPLIDEARVQGIEPIVIGRTWRLDPTGVPRLATLLRREHASIVHGWLSMANAFARLAGIIARVPVRIASEGAVLPTVDLRRLRRDTLIERALAHATDAYTANSEAVAAGLRERGIAASKIVVIRNGVRLARPLTDRSRAAIRSELGAVGDEPLVGMTARLDLEFKDQVTFLRAASALVSSGRQIRIAVIGEGAGRHVLEDLARELGIADRVHFTGFRLDSAQLISGLDVSVMLGFEHSEGFSNSILEAMAAGVPLVATDIPPNREALTDGVHGLLVPPRGIDEAAASIARLLDDPQFAARLGAAARARAGSEYSLEAQGARTMELYERLLAAKRRR